MARHQQDQYRSPAGQASDTMNTHGNRDRLFSHSGVLQRYDVCVTGSVFVSCFCELFLQDPDHLYIFGNLVSVFKFEVMSRQNILSLLLMLLEVKDLYDFLYELKEQQLASLVSLFSRQNCI